MNQIFLIIVEIIILIAEIKLFNGNAAPVMKNRHRKIEETD